MDISDKVADDFQTSIFNCMQPAQSTEIVSSATGQLQRIQEHICLSN
jgi:hypothetical protein